MFNPKEMRETFYCRHYCNRHISSSVSLLVIVEDCDIPIPERFDPRADTWHRDRATPVARVYSDW